VGTSRYGYRPQRTTRPHKGWMCLVWFGGLLAIGGELDCYWCEHCSENSKHLG
jgi:hypothetical protein